MIRLLEEKHPSRPFPRVPRASIRFPFLPPPPPFPYFRYFRFALTIGYFKLLSLERTRPQSRVSFAFIFRISFEIPRARRGFGDGVSADFMRICDIGNDDDETIG